MASTTNLGLRKPARTDYVSVVTDISDNMDKIDGAIGALPSGSNLQTEINGKADKVSSPTNGNFAALDGNGNLTDSGHKHSDYATKVSGATNGNFASLDSNGNLVDSGHKHSDYVVTASLISGNKYRLTL